MTIAWIAARTEPRIFNTLYAGPRKIRVFAPSKFMPYHVLSGEIAVIVIDINDRPSLNLCTEICGQQIVPVLAIVADLAYAQAALEAGAADFMVAPINPIEVLLRLHKLTRFADIVRVGDLEINLDALSVWTRGHQIDLSRVEFQLLATLARRVGQMVDHTTILGEVWDVGEESKAFARLKSYIGRLRRKIEPDLQNPQYIVSIPGTGYRLRNQKQWELNRLTMGNPHMRL
jgi:DNA-binding response OmpR family regulator